MTHRRPPYRLIALLLLGAGIIPADAPGQARSTTEATLTGTWEITVQTGGRRGRSEVLTLRQNADGSLTGAFIVESRRSEEPILEGRVDNSAFSFTRNRVQARYEGTIDGDEISGTMTQPSGNRVLSYSFSGTRTSDEVISFATPAEAPPGAESPQPPARAASSASPSRIARTVIEPSRSPSTTPAQATAAGQAAAFPAACMTNCVGEGELTMDGQTLSFTLTQCTVTGRGGGTWSGSGESERGSITVSAGMQQSPALRHTAQITLPDGVYRADYAQESSGWTRETRDERRIFRVPAQGPLVAHDDASVTASGTFSHRDNYTDHAIELKIACRSR